MIKKKTKSKINEENQKSKLNDSFSSLESDSDTESELAENEYKFYSKKRDKHIEANDYQINAFNSAKEENKIVYLETGEGKTLVSIILMKHFLKKKGIGKKPKIFFVVVTQNLRDQQGNEIRDFLPWAKTRILKATCNKKNSVYKDGPGFRKELEEYEIFVLIDQILLEILRHGYLKIWEIDLIIFDECHHANGNHNYNLIMQEFYLEKYIQRETSNPKILIPQILGLTASPLKKKINKTEVFLFLVF